jgi:hypothetical protein
LAGCDAGAAVTEVAALTGNTVIVGLVTFTVAVGTSVLAGAAKLVVVPHRKTEITSTAIILFISILLCPLLDFVMT